LTLAPTQEDHDLLTAEDLPEGYAKHHERKKTYETQDSYDISGYSDVLHLRMKRVNIRGQALKSGRRVCQFSKARLNFMQGVLFSLALYKVSQTSGHKAAAWRMGRSI
jgi:hypothetical protein